MTELILIRHGQANSAGENYDELTETGREQAHRVGAWLAASGFAFDRALHGGLKRQEATLGAIHEEFAESGTKPPAMEIHPGLAEFDLKVFYTLAAEMRHGNPEFAEVLKAWNKARHSDAPGKGETFKRLMAFVIAEWTRRGEDFTAAESFPIFQKRVLSVLEIHRAQAAMENRNPAMEFHSGKILAVTSGGPISLLVGAVLGLDTAPTLGLIRRIYNTSVHQITLGDGRRDLVSFNSVPHLTVAERTLV